MVLLWELELFIVVLLSTTATVCCLLRGLVVLLQGDFTFALSAGLLSTCCCRCCSRYGVDVFAHSARARRYSAATGPTRAACRSYCRGTPASGQSVSPAAQSALRRLLVTFLSSSVVGGGGGDLFHAVLVWRCKLLLWSFLVLMWLHAQCCSAAVRLRLIWIMRLSSRVAACSSFWRCRRFFVLSECLSIF